MFLLISLAIFDKLNRPKKNHDFECVSDSKPIVIERDFFGLMMKYEIHIIECGF
jgi:hypothetical protein